MVAEAIDDIHRTYYRKIPKDQLADDAIAGRGREARRPLLSYLSPKDYGRFQQDQNSEFSGIGVAVARHPLGLRVAGRLRRSAAKRAGLAPGDLIVAVGDRSLRGRRRDRRDGPDQGPGRQRRAPDVAARGQAHHPHADPQHGERAGRRQPHADGAAAAARSASCGWRVQLRRARRGLPGAPGGAQEGRQGLRPGPARQRRRTRQRGPARGQRVPRGRADRDDPRALGARAHAARHRQPRRPQGAARRPGQQRDRVGLGDRHRRAPGPRPREGRRRRDLRQGRLPAGARAAPTAARWTSPPASTSRPTGATSAAAASRPGRASSPTSPAKDLPATPADEGLDKAVGVVGRACP